jgi:hypothetical protein
MRADLPDAGAFQRLFAVWEKSASAMADGASRNARVLELGAAVMRAHLLWARAMQASLEAWTCAYRSTMEAATEAATEAIDQ